MKIKKEAKKNCAIYKISRYICICVWGVYKYVYGAARMYNILYVSKVYTSKY